MPKLTAVTVRNAKPGRHADGLGLYLLVKPSGSRSWLLRVQHAGKRRDIGLGSVTDLTLAEAREKSAGLRKLARQGRDPIAERDKDKRCVPTFAEAVGFAWEDLGKGWSVKHAADFKTSLETHIVPRLGRRGVDVIDEAMVRDALAPIWMEKPETARKIAIRIRQVLAYAKARKWRTDHLPDAKEVRRGLAKPPRGGHFAALPYRDVPAFVTGQSELAGTVGRLALLFTIFTAARSGEVRAATWKQIDLEARTWTRPAEIMKMRVQHVVGLSEEAIAILERAKPYSGGSGLIFPGKSGKPLSDMTLTKVLRDAGASVTVHGFRSSFRDWCAEQMPTMPAMVAEMALAHSVGTATERAYLRSDLQDMRRQLMAAWGQYCSRNGQIDPLAELRPKHMGGS